MTGFDDIVGTFLRLWKAAHAVKGPQGVEAVFSAGD